MFRANSTKLFTNECVSELSVRSRRMKLLSFTDLKSLLNTTDGNVSVHARKLEDAGYLECLKSFNGRVPLTEYKITNSGREALNSYLNHMEALINAMKGK